MIPGPRLIAVLMLCIILSPWRTSLAAGEPPDPWSDLRPRHAVACLGDLRALLDAQPDDQRLLGLAIGAYVALCLNAHPEIDGAFGPWLEYARTLVTRRRAARRQAPPPTLEAEASELWVRLIDGDAVGVVAELDRFPTEAATPQGFALRALATSDWRPLAKSRVQHALVDYARMVLFHRTLAGQVGIDVSDLELIDPYVIQRSLWLTGFDAKYVVSLPGEAVAGVGWLLQSRQIDDPTAVAEAGQLLAALGATVDPAIGRAQLIAQLQRAARTMAPDNAQAFAVAERIALSHCDAEQGVRGKDGHHLLVGLGDMAQWVRSRLLDAAYFAYVDVWNHTPGYPDEKTFSARDKKLGAALRTLLPDALLTAEVGIGLVDPSFTNMDEPSPLSSVELLAKAITAERARAHPLPDRQLVCVIAKLAKRRAALAQPIVVDLLAHWPAVDGIPVRTGLQELLRAAWRCDVESDLAQIARAAARRCPADVPLHHFAALFNPDERFLAWDGLAPSVTWDEPTIDCRKHNFPHLKDVGGNFAVTWDGWLKIDAPGRYEFKVISDGYFKARIGDLVLVEQQNTVFSPELVVRTLARGRDWVPGWLPVWLDYEHRGGDGAECRLQWKPPGATDFTPLPAALLAHGAEHASGLSAHAVEALRALSTFEQLTGESPAAFTWVSTMPWHASIQSTLGTCATMHRQYRQMMPLLRTAEAMNPGVGSAHLITCLLMQPGAEIDEAMALIRVHGFQRGGLPEQRLLISHLRDEHRIAAFVAALRANGQWEEPGHGYLRMLIGLTTGDFAVIHPDMDKEIGGINPWVVHTELRPLCLLDTALCRMLVKPPPVFERLREQAGVHKDRGYQTALACLGGIADQPTIAALSVWDQDLVRWAAALLELSEGNHAQAQPLLAALEKNANTDPSIAELCRDLLAWYATQTPASLATVPKAAPVKRRVNAGTKPGSDDF